MSSEGIEHGDHPSCKIPNDNPEDVPRAYLDLETSRLAHPWTVGGSPIVDGKYLDLDTNQVKEIQPRESVGFGPPTIDIYWHNISLSGGSTQFRGFRGVFVYGNVGLYIARLGLFFGKTGGSCELYSLNATPYTVTVIVMTERTYHEIKEQYYDCGLGGPRPTRRTVPDEPSSAPQNQSNSQTGVSQDQ